jgi:hypothetical protein
MKGVDLRTFQFDYDLTFAAFFLNGDGTVYGRYGTRAGSKTAQATHVSPAAYRRALERALEAHKNYPGNAKPFAGKRGPRPAADVPEALPDLKKFAGEATTKKNCIHCHTAGESLLREKKARRALTSADLWPYPLPENVGLRLDRDDDLRVAAVEADSPAARAGLRPGDELRTLDGQLVLSLADVQWALHRAPDEARLPVTFRRDNQTKTAVLTLLGPWRERDTGWRDTFAALRANFRVAPLTEDEKQRRGLPADGTALQVRYALGSAANAGLQANDVIVSVDGAARLRNEGQLLAHMYVADPSRRRLALKVQRGDRTFEVVLPVE